MQVPGVTDGFANIPAMRRVYDFWLGGRDNFAADREQAHRIEAAYPAPPFGQLAVPAVNVRTARRFLERAVAWTAEQGCGQFAQLCAGPPSPPQYQPLHEVARDVIPGARFCYADGDRMTASLIRAHTDGQDVAVVEGSSAEPDTLLPALKEAVDFGEPVTLILGMIMQALDAGTARDVAAAYVSAMAPGSFLVLTCPACDDRELWGRLRAARAACAWNHPQQTIRSFFDGTELAGPGLVLARAWRPACPQGMRPDVASYVLAGVGRKS